RRLAMTAPLVVCINARAFIAVLQASRALDSLTRLVRRPARSAEGVGAAVRSHRAADSVPDRREAAIPVRSTAPAASTRTEAARRGDVLAAARSGRARVEALAAQVTRPIRATDPRRADGSASTAVVRVGL